MMTWPLPRLEIWRHTRECITHNAVYNTHDGKPRTQLIGFHVQHCIQEFLTSRPVASSSGSAVQQKTEGAAVPRSRLYQFSLSAAGQLCLLLCVDKSKTHAVTTSKVTKNAADAQKLVSLAFFVPVDVDEGGTVTDAYAIVWKPADAPEWETHDPNVSEFAYGRHLAADSEFLQAINARTRPKFLDSTVTAVCVLPVNIALLCRTTEEVVTKGIQPFLNELREEILEHAEQEDPYEAALAHGLRLLHSTPEKNARNAAWLLKHLKDVVYMRYETQSGLSVEDFEDMVGAPPWKVEAEPSTSGPSRQGSVEPSASGSGTTPTSANATGTQHYTPFRFSPRAIGRLCLMVSLEAAEPDFPQTIRRRRRVSSASSIGNVRATLFVPVQIAADGLIAEAYTIDWQPADVKALYERPPGAEYTGDFELERHDAPDSDLLRAINAGERPTTTRFGGTWPVCYIAVLPVQLTSFVLGPESLLEEGIRPFLQQLRELTRLPVHSDARLSVYQVLLGQYLRLSYSTPEKRADTATWLLEHINRWAYRCHEQALERGMHLLVCEELQHLLRSPGVMEAFRIADNAEKGGLL